MERKGKEAEQLRSYLLPDPSDHLVSLSLTFNLLVLKHYQAESEIPVYSIIFPNSSSLRVKGRSALRATRQCFGKIWDPLSARCMQSIEIDVLAQPDSCCTVTCVCVQSLHSSSLFFFASPATLGGRVCPLPPLSSPRAAARAIQLRDTLPVL